MFVVFDSVQFMFGGGANHKDSFANMPRVGSNGNAAAVHQQKV